MREQSYRQLPLPVKAEDPEFTFDLGMLQQNSPEFFGLPSAFMELWHMHRYIAPDGTPIPMIHRPDLQLHTQRVLRLSEKLGKVVERDGEEVNFRRLSHVATAHDMPEIVTGDVLSTIKESLSDAQKLALSQLEDEGIRIVAERFYPPYLRQMLIGHFEEARERKTTLSQIVKIADVWDGMGEALHEIRCGNEQEFLPILENSEKRFGQLRDYPVWQTLASHPELGLAALPSQDEARSLPKIKPETYEREGRDAFWQSVLHPDVPQWHKIWLNTSLIGFHKVGTALFPGWKKEIGNQQLETYLPYMYRQNGRLL